MLDELIKVFGRPSVVGEVGVAKGEARADRLVDVEDVGVLVEAVRIGAYVALPVDVARAAAVKYSVDGRDSGAAVEEEDDGRVLGFMSSFKEPEEYVCIFLDWNLFPCWDFLFG